MALQRSGATKVQSGVDNLRPFNIGNLSGSWSNSPNMGQLPKEYVDMLKALAQTDDVYVIYSYRTPIAWRARNSKTWTIPNVKYSVTTTNHQNVVKVAVENPNFYS